MLERRDYELMAKYDASENVEFARTASATDALDGQIARSDPWPLSERHSASDRAASAMPDAGDFC
jgi:hypothetical protein